MPRPPLLHVYSTFAVGGPQVRFAAIANHFGTRWRHVIIAMDGNLACRERLARELDVAFPQVEIRKGDVVGNVLRFRAALKQIRPQALITNNWGAIEWAMANALPTVRHVHVEDGFGPEERVTQLPRRVRLRQLLLRRATVVVPSRTLHRIATETWRLRDVRYVPNGIDLTRFAMPERNGAAEVVVGTVAALRPEKNLVRLLRAFRIMRDNVPGRLIIAGDGPERPMLEAEAARLGLDGDVDFTGHTDEPQLLYGRFDIFALSSDTEQMPMSVLEAMAAGLPVAATDVGDVRLLLARENAGLVAPPDEGALAAALLALAADPARRLALGAANRARAEQEFDQKDMFRAWTELFGCI
jgi:glycosyltransferase involved in cell wall biosynthesis